ncbi:HigA family addiction module antitoxin [Leclercia sp. Marseille-Q4284]|uniref:HigA family addiction module antitoxin n=1 Tax=Leclercia sp. Marseille-Q4284 TaxID=2866582 RepID=UPI001CE43C47|nr:HigA family addiction module antitoxin [Leclercia sp. Marseille-Q4284]
MTEVFTPPPHPGEILGEELFMRGLNQSEAARLLGLRKAVVCRLVNQVYGLSPSVAYRLEKAGLYTAFYWLKLQAEYDIWRMSLLNFSDVQTFPARYGSDADAIG